MMNIRIAALASLILVSLGSGCASTSHPSLTVYCHEGELVRTDLGEPGPSHADITTWWADVHDVLPESRNPEDSEVVGLASGYNIVTGPIHLMQDGKSHEYRVSNFHLSFLDSDDDIVWSGIHDYVHDQGQLINIAKRPITGGSGRFRDARGEGVVTPLGDDWFKVEIFLKD
ncbi:MAG: hypothetical protein CMJ67_05855 [Planctomycetaceae bacterium]|nr:hypothetical protein [Planctomycetaceae bacterium]